jgi:hypothetical protein
VDDEWLLVWRDEKDQENKKGDDRRVEKWIRIKRQEWRSRELKKTESGDCKIVLRVEGSVDEGEWVVFGSHA